MKIGYQLPQQTGVDISQIEVRLLTEVLYSAHLYMRFLVDGALLPRSS